MKIQMKYNKIPKDSYTCPTKALFTLGTVLRV
ncbi:hypothetical protein COLO4_04378 [Corchorus olitorius]|uniref:Uncharacterized protein n=1 Tax=Corchorus olitorius TaxID=93759 RepID=A0A1R3KU65_9ROSI|nr:hypothetical protein COLO4_04378 [Corchorus olitorius]